MVILGLDPTLSLSLTADWLISISTAWVAAAIILPSTHDWPKRLNLSIVAINLILAFAFFVVALILVNKL